VVLQGTVYVPKVGVIRIRQSQPVAGESKRDFQTGRLWNWDVSLITEFTIPDLALALAHPARVVAIDLGLKDFVVLSDTRRVPAPQLSPPGAQATPSAADLGPAVG
jgi:putative transposase